MVDLDMKQLVIEAYHNGQQERIQPCLLKISSAFVNFICALVSYKGVGIFFHVLHVYYSIHQKCSKLYTFTARAQNLGKGIKIKI
jgi:hypothetical protein